MNKLNGILIVSALLAAATTFAKTDSRALDLARQ